MSRKSFTARNRVFSGKSLKTSPSSWTPLRKGYVNRVSRQETKGFLWEEIIDRHTSMYRKGTLRMNGQFVKACPVSDVPEGKMKMVQLGNDKVCLANVSGKLYAIGNTCTHVGGPLAQGSLNGHIVTCPWHGSQFDVTTGEVKHGPAAKPEPVYEVKVEGTSLLVRAR